MLNNSFAKKKIPKKKKRKKIYKNYGILLMLKIYIKGKKKNLNCFIVNKKM